MLTNLELNLKKNENKNKKMCTCTHTYTGILLSQKKNGILPFATAWMELECIMLSDISQSEEDKP